VDECSRRSYREEDWGQSEKPSSSKTLKVSCRCHSEESADKAKRGRGAKVFRSNWVENLQDLTAQEGIEALADVTTLSVSTDRCSE
jgi:hypothetical protein